MPKPRSLEENLLVARNMIRIFEHWDANDPPEVRKAKMRPVLREISKEFLEREAMKEAMKGAQDFTSRQCD